MYKDNFNEQQKTQALKYPPIKEYQLRNPIFMIDNGLQYRFVNIDRTVFIKTKEERREVSLAKSTYKGTVLKVNTNNLTK
jgi:hypothetical protein